MEKSTGQIHHVLCRAPARNPWEPLHVDLGYPAAVSTVTRRRRGIHTVVEPQESGGALVNSMTAGASPAMPSRPAGPRPWCWGRSTRRRLPPPGSAAKT
jgi:hypothetical protein